MRKNLLFLVILSLFSTASFAQDFSNKGKDFWFAYPAHNAGTVSRLAIYITSDQTTTGTVEFNGNTIPFSVVANQTTIVRVGNATLPSNATCYIGSNNVVEVNKGIHIVALKPVAAYAHILNAAVSGSTLLLPTNVLGKEYVVSSYVPQGNTAGVERCQFVIVGVENNSTVEITPINADISNSHPANVPFQINLNRGDVYQYQSFNELSGTKVVSIANGTSDCKPIVVIGSTTRSAIGCATAGSGDNLFQQLTPKSSWGKNYITVPFILKNRDIIRIYVSNPTAPVTVNGSVLAVGTLINNSFYELSASTTQQISSTEGIAVFQYIITQNCDGVNSDPEMILINSVEQTLNDISFVSAHQALTPPNTNITNHYLNVIIKDQGTALSSLILDGAIVPAASFTPVGTTNYKYARINLTATTTAANPTHRILSDSGFIAIAYGYGNVESYGYNAGTNIKDLNKNLEFQNLFSIINANSACTNSPVVFKIFLPDSTTNIISGITSAIRYDSMKWNVNAPAAFVPNNFPIRILGDSLYVAPNAGMRVRPDSLRVRNGKPVAWYSIQPPTNYTINTPGTYTLTVTGYRTSVNEGCVSGNDVEFSFDFIVAPPPVPSFDNNTPGCSADTVRFTETTAQGPIPTFYPTYKFKWFFGDPYCPPGEDSSILRNPIHKYSRPGSYQVTFTNITTPGCFSNTAFKTIIIPDTVKASIAGIATLCQSAIAGSTLPITFTGVNGVLPYTFTYTPYTNGVAGIPVNIDSDPGLPTKTIQVPTTTAGVYRFVLTNVKNANPAFCTVPINNQEATITVNPLPTATLAGTTNVCKNSAPAPVVTFTATGGATPTTIYQFTYIPTVNGVAGASQTINSNAAGIAIITVPTTTIGTFKYDVISVKDNGTGCSKTLTAGATTTATVFVQDNPTATIATNDAAECVNGTQPTITFTGNSGNAQPLTYTFNYTITTNGVAGIAQNITTTTASNTATLTVPVTTNAIYIYTLNSVTTNSTNATSCVTTVPNATATVTINPIPSASISGGTTACQVAGAQSITLTGAGGTRPYTFTYSINGVVQPTVVSDPGLDTKVLTVSTVVGNYVYKISNIQDASSSTCIRNYVAPNEPTATVLMQATSTATILGTTTVCKDATAPTITFTAANGVAPFTFYYHINGGAAQSVSSAVGSFTTTITASMLLTGTFIYTLDSVKNTGTINCTSPITGQTATVIINPIPTATINVAGTNAITVCQNTGIQPITFIGANATGGAGAVYVFNYTISTNGGTPVAQPALTGNNVVINQPTTAFGVYTYLITSVKDNATGCTKTYTTNAPTAVVTVKELATATIATSVPTVCQNSTTLPTITFTATGGLAPYRFKYTITTNGITGAVQTTPLTSFGNSLTLTVPTTTAGTYVYTLVSVEESSAANCVNAQIGSAQVIVHPQPTASYAISSPYCAQQAITFTPSQNITPTGSVVSWVWNYGNGTGTQIRTDGNPFTITYATAGVKPVSFKVVSDNGCESLLATTPAVVINSKPKAGFINPEACLADAFAQFTDTSSVVGGSIVYWEWDFGDGTPIYAGATLAHKNPLHAFATVGNKTVKLTVTTNSGCKSDTTQQFFINGEVTSADFIQQNGGMFCSNRPVQIKENSVVNVGGLIRVDIYWDNVGAPTIVEIDDLPTLGKIYTHNYPNLQVDKTYKVRYIAYSGFNGVCQKETTKDVIVRAAPIAAFTPPINVCLNGGPIQLGGSEIGNVGGTTTYIGTGVSPTGLFNPLLVGPGITDTVTFTAISPFNCDSALKRPIHVLIPPVANFETVGNLCVGGPSNANVVKFHQTSTVTLGEGGAIVKWIYDWGDGTPVQTFTSGADVTHVYTTAGPKTATLIVEDAFGCRNAPAKQLPFTVNPLPIPRYEVTGACLPNASILFTNTTLNLASNSYQWSFELPSTSAANTSTASTNTVSHTYTTQGPFNTHLIATNIATGCKDSTTIKVVDATYIHPEPIVSFGAIPDQCLYNGNYQLIQGSEASGIVGTYSGGPWVSSSGIFNPLLAGVGTHTITYTCISSFNCPSSKTQTVKVLAPPVVDIFVTLGNKCERNDIVFHNEITQGAGLVNTWVYNWGDGNTQTVNNGDDINHQYTLAGTYTATLSLVTNNGCRSRINPPNQLQVIVNPLPKPNFTYSDTACLPQANVLFKNTTPNINDWAYKWYFDVPPVNALDSSTQRTNINHVYYTQAPHKAKLYALSPTTFCRDSITRPILTIHPAPFANFDFSRLSVCIGQDVKVIDKSSFADGTFRNWDWNWGDGSSSVGQNPSSHVYGSPRDNYSVTLQVTNSFGCVDDTSRLFAVYELPTANAGRDSVILQGGDLTLTPIVTGRQLTYFWSGTPAPENLSSKIFRNPIASPVEDITYTLLVTGIGGCMAPLDNVFIKVLKAPVIPNTFTPNNDGVHDTWIIKYLESYPDNRVQVFTRAGQLVFESRRYVKPWDGTVNGKSLPFDTYYYIIEPGTGRPPITGYVTIVK